MEKSKPRLKQFNEIDEISKKEIRGEISQKEAERIYFQMGEDERKVIENSKKIYIIAMVDVLGFKNMLDNYPIIEIFQIYRKLHLKTWNHLEKQNEVLVIGLKTSKIIRHPIKYAFFSDTILIWEKMETGEANVQKKVKRFITSIQYLVSNSLAKELPLRAGIAYGECILMPEENIFIGKPLAEAYITESNQEWAGAAFHPSSMNFINSIPSTPLIKDFSDLIVEYSVPLKKKMKKKSRPNNALVLINRKNIEKAIKKILSNIKSKNIKCKEKVRIEKKYKNTTEFLNFLKLKSI